MKLVLAIVNNDDSAEVASILTKEGVFYHQAVDNRWLSHDR